jgi:hypothetical protein
MCERFFNTFTDDIAKQVSECSCYSLKKSCLFFKNGQDSQHTIVNSQKEKISLSNKNIRDIFIEGQMDELFGYSHTPLFKLFDYTKEFSHMAMCYLHEGNVNYFFELLSPLKEHLFNYVRSNLEIEQVFVEKMYLKNLFASHLKCLSPNIFDNVVVHVGFGPYNERDELRFWGDLEDIRYKKFTPIGVMQEYILVSLRYLL